MFTAGEMFTALALFNQLAVCLSVFPVTLPILIKGLVSRNRSVRSMSYVMSRLGPLKDLLVGGEVKAF